MKFLATPLLCTKDDQQLEKAHTHTLISRLAVNHKETTHVVCIYWRSYELEYWTMITTLCLKMDLCTKDGTQRWLNTWSFDNVNRSTAAESRTHGSELCNETFTTPVCAVDMLQCNVRQTQTIVVSQRNIQIVNKHHVRVLQTETHRHRLTNKLTDRQTDRLTEIICYDNYS